MFPLETLTTESPDVLTKSLFDPAAEGYAAPPKKPLAFVVAFLGL